MFNSRFQFLLSFITILGASSQVFAQWEALPEQAPAPADNPTTAAKIELGRSLFFDPRLSSTGTVSCNSCHNVMLGGDDNRPVSMGVHGKLGGRSAPTVWNAAFNSSQFWDGRAKSLEEQALGPITNPIEMGLKDHAVAIKRIRAIKGYTPMFNKAFGGKNAVTVDNLARAIAAYERTLITPNSPYDRYVKGDKSAMTAKQVKGMKIFASLGCTGCHMGAAFSGPSMAPGTGFFMKFPTYTNNEYVKKYALMTDKGRADKHEWKVPTLRNIALTAPYFHNGSVDTLKEAVRVMARTQLDKKLNKAQVDKLVAFLNALTGEFPVQPMPRLPSTDGWTFTSK